GVLDVTRAPQATLDHITRPLGQELFQLLGGEVILARLADAGRYLAEQFIDQRTQMRLDVAVEEVGAHEAYAAVRNHKSVRNEVVVGMLDGEIVHHPAIFDWLYRSDALPDHSALAQSAGRAFTILLEGRKEI